MEVAYIAAFYKDISDEIRRLREEQWRLSYYFIVEGMGVIYLFADNRSEKFLNIYVLSLALILQLGCAAMYLYHLHVNHNYIGRARVVRRKLEHFFGMHDLKLPSGEQVMPTEWRGLTLNKWFEYDTVVIPLSLFVLSVQGASVYVVIRRVVETVRC